MFLHAKVAWMAGHTGIVSVIITKENEMEQSRYLVSAYWRGAMNVGKMRTFDLFTDATAYALQLEPESDDDGGYFSTFVRVYQIFDDKPPVQIKKYR